MLSNFRAYENVPSDFYANSPSAPRAIYSRKSRGCGPGLSIDSALKFYYTAREKSIEGTLMIAFKVCAEDVKPARIRDAGAARAADQEVIIPGCGGGRGAEGRRSQCPRSILRRGSRRPAIQTWPLHSGERAVFYHSVCNFSRLVWKWAAVRISVQVDRASQPLLLVLAEHWRVVFQEEAVLRRPKKYFPDDHDENSSNSRYTCRYIWSRESARPSKIFRLHRGVFPT